MKYFKNLFNSFVNPATYRQFITSKSKKALSHFILSMIIIGVIQGIYLTSIGLPTLREKAQVSLDELMKAYPEDLKISWDGEMLTTSPEEYHQIRFDLNQLTLFREIPGNTASTRSMLYINEDLSLGEAVDLMNEESVISIFDQKSIFVDSEEGGIQELLLSDYFQDTEFIIDKESLPEIRDFLGQGLDATLKMAVWFLPIAISLGLIISRLFLSLIFATLLLFPARLGSAISNWKESWRFTLVLLVVVEILSQLSRLLYPELRFPVYSVAFWSLSLFILLALNSQKAQKQTKKRSSR